MIGYKFCCHVMYRNIIRGVLFSNELIEEKQGKKTKIRVIHFPFGDKQRDYYNLKMAWPVSVSYR